MPLFLLLLVLLINEALSAGFDPVSVICDVNGCKVPAIIDTGAEISVMSLSCASRCGLKDLIDPQHSGRAIGVGSSEIIGGIEGLGLRIGPLSFRNKVSILRDSRCDFLIGLDILRRFKCDISLKEKMIKLHVNNEEIRISLSSSGNFEKLKRVVPEKGIEEAEELPLPCPPIAPRGGSYNQTEDNFDDYYYDEYENDYDDCVSMEGV